MKKNHLEKDTLFFAYQSANESYCNNVDSIKRAISEFNSHQKTIQAITWEDLRSSGSFISKEILKYIDSCNFFACDLTLLNHNVLFELGYAIAKGKNIFIFLNEDIEKAKDYYCNFFLKNIKYTPFKNYKEIHTTLQNKEYSNEHIKKVIPLENINEENDIFFLENTCETQAALDLDDFLNSLKMHEHKLKVKINDPYEVDYQPFSYYIQNIQKANCIIFHMLSTEYDNAFLENGKYSFLAGIACGLNKNVLLIAPAKFKCPLDYDDILIDYKSSDLCIAKVNNWINNHIEITINIYI